MSAATNGGSVYFDSTAVLALQIDVAARRVAVGEFERAPAICVGALALTEVLAAADRLTDEPLIRLDLEDAVRRMWDTFHVVPVDRRCLDDAGELLRQQPLRLAGAIHLAAAARLPTPVRFVTFDAAQIPVAIALGYTVIST